MQATLPRHLAAYYSALQSFDRHGAASEGAVRIPIPFPAPGPRVRLGNRSALEWVVDQYRVKTDRRSGITSDPNDPEDPEKIVRLVKQVVTVSLETVRIVRTLPPLGVESVEAFRGINQPDEAMPWRKLKS